jgi:hypothetical protein
MEININNGPVQNLATTDVDSKKFAPSGLERDTPISLQFDNKTLQIMLVNKNMLVSELISLIEKECECKVKSVMYAGQKTNPDLRLIDYNFPSVSVLNVKLEGTQPRAIQLERSHSTVSQDQATARQNGSIDLSRTSSDLVAREMERKRKQQQQLETATNLYNSLFDYIQKNNPEEKGFGYRCTYNERNVFFDAVRKISTLQQYVDHIGKDNLNGLVFPLSKWTPFYLDEMSQFSFATASSVGEQLARADYFSLLKNSESIVAALEGLAKLKETIQITHDYTLLMPSIERLTVQVQHFSNNSEKLMKVYGETLFEPFHRSVDCIQKFEGKGASLEVRYKSFVEFYRNFLEVQKGFNVQSNLEMRFVKQRWKESVGSFLSVALSSKELLQILNEKELEGLNKDKSIPLYEDELEELEFVDVRSAFNVMLSSVADTLVLPLSFSFPKGTGLQTTKINLKANLKISEITKRIEQETNLDLSKYIITAIKKNSETLNNDDTLDQLLLKLQYPLDKPFEVSIERLNTNMDVSN